MALVLPCNERKQRGTIAEDRQKVLDHKKELVVRRKPASQAQSTTYNAIAACRTSAGVIAQGTLWEVCRISSSQFLINWSVQGAVPTL